MNSNPCGDLIGHLFAKVLGKGSLREEQLRAENRVSYTQPSGPADSQPDVTVRGRAQSHPGLAADHPSFESWRDSAGLRSRLDRPG